MRHHTHIKRAVNMFKSQARLAAAMGCSQQQIGYLLTSKTISADMAVKVHNATSGQISKHQLRPDIFGAAPELERVS